MVELVPDRLLHEALRLVCGKPVLGLPLELGILDEDREQGTRAAHYVVRGDLIGLFQPDQLAMGAKTFRKRRAETLFVRAAHGGGHGVAEALAEAVMLAEPVVGEGHGPFDRAHASVALHPPGKGVGDELGVSLHLRQPVGEPAGEGEHGFGRNIGPLDQMGRTLPADLHAAAQEGLRPSHREETRGLDHAAAEDLVVGLETNGSSAPVLNRPEILDGALGQTSRINLTPELAVARHLDDQFFRERVHDGDADPVKTAGGLVGLVGKLAAGVQRGEHHFERGLVRKFRVRVDRNAAAVIGDGDIALVVEAHLDAVGVAGHRLVHGVVEHFGEEVVQGALVGAADIHARTFAHRLQPFEHLDGGGVVSGALRTAGGRCAGGGFRRGLGSGRLRLGRWGGLRFA